MYKYIILVILMLSIASFCTCNAESDINQDSINIDAFMRNTSFVSWQGDNRNRSIVCFDVDNSGRIVMGTRNGNECKVYILNPDGEFIAGYSFYYNASFAVQWMNNDIAIYWLRSSIVGVFSLEGKCKSLDTYPAGEVVAHIGSLSSRSMRINNTRYQMDTYNPLFTLLSLRHYSRIVMYKQDAQAETIIDMNYVSLPFVVLSVIGAISFIIIPIIVLRRYVIRK